MIEILGERKTGTNYARRMITLNYTEPVISNGWKHRYLTEVKNDVLYICCIRDPYQWLKSIFVKPYEMDYLRGKDFAAAIRTQIKDPDGLVFTNLIHLWNKKNTRYLTIPEKRRHFLKHEDVIKDCGKEFAAIQDKFGLTASGQFKNIFNHVDDMGVNNKPFKENPYFDIDRKTKDFINSHLDKQLMNKLAYSLQ